MHFAINNFKLKRVCGEWVGDYGIIGCVWSYEAYYEGRWKTFVGAGNRIRVHRLVSRGSNLWATASFRITTHYECFSKFHTECFKQRSYQQIDPLSGMLNRILKFLVGLRNVLLFLTEDLCWSWLHLNIIHSNTTQRN